MTTIKERKKKNTKSKGADQRGHKRGRREWVGKMKGRGMEWLGSEGKVWVQNGVPWRWGCEKRGRGGELWNRRQNSLFTFKKGSIAKQIGANSNSQFGFRRWEYTHGRFTPMSHKKPYKWTLTQNLKTQVYGSFIYLYGFQLFHSYTMLNFTS